jgi:hypothetical protein
MQDTDAGDATSRLVTGLRDAAATVGTVVTLANAGQMPEPTPYFAPAVEPTAIAQSVEAATSPGAEPMDGSHALRDVAASVEQAADASRRHDAVATDTEALPADPPGLYRDVSDEDLDAVDTDPYAAEAAVDPYAAEADADPYAAEGIDGGGDIGGPDAGGAGW